jgi:Domain of unknown function (DUF4157)
VGHQREHEHGASRQRTRRDDSAAARTPDLAPRLGNAALQRLIRGAISRSASEPAPIDEEVGRAIEAARGAGRPLDPAARPELESALGEDFSEVRVHTDATADHLSRAVEATAFTTGSDIFFRSGTYEPLSSAGRKLLAHELTHVVQQRGAPPAQELRVTDPGDASEREAEAVAEQVARSPAGRGTASEPVDEEEIARDQEGIAESVAPSPQNPLAPMADSRPVVMLRRTAGNRGATRVVGARSIPSRRTPTGKALLQRDVGFEFQTGWGVRERGPYRRYHRQEVIVDFGQFRLTADEANTPLGAEIEFVVPHLAENQRNQMDAALTALVQFAQDMNAYKDHTIFTLDRASNNPAHTRVEVHPTIKGTGDMSANPQVTSGVRLDRLTRMFTELGNPQGPHASAQGDLVRVGGGPGLANAAAAVAHTTVNGNPASDEFKGLAALIITYLQMGRTATGVPGLNQPTLNYAKASLTLLARTDFRGMYRRLPLNERTYFTAHPRRFRRKMLDAAHTLNPPAGALNPDADVLERGIHGVAVNVTRRAWLEGIAADRDLLKRGTDPLLFGFGSRGKHTDLVGPGQAHRGAVLEFRTMGKAVAYTDWQTLGMSVFDYIAALNQ